MQFSGHDCNNLIKVILASFALLRLARVQVTQAGIGVYLKVHFRRRQRTPFINCFSCLVIWLVLPRLLPQSRQSRISGSQVQVPGTMTAL
jgi:hypothetical protein